MGDIVLNPPSERVCRRCGRHEVWDDGRGEWRVACDGDTAQVGDGFCIHEWDITGTHKPIKG